MRSAKRAFATSGSTGEITGAAAVADDEEDEEEEGPAEEDGALPRLAAAEEGALGASSTFLAFSFSLRF